MLPQNKSLNATQFKINNKKINLIPWSNIQISNLNTYSNFDDIYDEYILNNIDYKGSLSILESNMIFVELYRISKSNNMQVKFKCSSCGGMSETTLKIDKCVSYTPMKETSLNTKNYKFSFKSYSDYKIKNDSNHEAIKYIASHINSFVYKEKLHKCNNIDELTEWLINEINNNDFEELVKFFTKNQPKINTDVNVICEYCVTEQKKQIQIKDFLV